MITRIWKWFWRPSATISLGVIAIVSGLGGVIFWGGFNTFMEYTNTLPFCISCHEMESTVYPEYKKTIHYSNRTGVRVICSDCHVPKDWTAKLVRKIKATKEVYHWLAGTINTPEKFEAHRLQMATNVWEEMKATDSRECRNCHSFEAMNFKLQARRPQEKHPVAIKEGKTCIDCHKGIAHNMPEEDDDGDD